VAQKRPVKRQKSESAGAKPRTKRAKEPSRKKKEVRVEETTKVTCIDEPIREKMFVTMDAQGNLKMFPLRTRAKQQDDAIGSSANANPQPPQPQLPLPQMEVPSPPPRPPQAEPVGSFHTPILAIRSLTLLVNCLRGVFRSRRIPS